MQRNRDVNETESGSTHNMVIHEQQEHKSSSGVYLEYIRIFVIISQALICRLGTLLLSESVGKSLLTTPAKRWRAVEEFSWNGDKRK